MPPVRDDGGDPGRFRSANGVDAADGGEDIMCGDCGGELPINSCVVQKFHILSRDSIQSCSKSKFRDLATRMAGGFTQ